jgi:hypothetical protein
MEFWKCVVVDDIRSSRRVEVVVCKLVAMWGALGAVSKSESGVGLRGRKGAWLPIRNSSICFVGYRT